MDIAHETLVFERSFDASPQQLFAAYADPRAREAWSAPSPGAEVRIDSCDLRTGGSEVGRCGGRGDLRWTTKVAYHLVQQDRLISFTEELWDGESLLTVALICFDIRPSGSRALLRLTDQVTSFVGRDGIDGHRQGYEKALDNLGDALALV